MLTGKANLHVHVCTYRQEAAKRQDKSAVAIKRKKIVPPSFLSLCVSMLGNNNHTWRKFCR